MRVLGCCECYPVVSPYRAYNPFIAPSTFSWVCSDRKITMRYGDQVANTPKIAAQDATLTVCKVDGGKTTFPVPSGTEVELHVPGLHHNRTLSSFVSWGKVLMMSCSTILEGAPQVHARAILW
jgi:hypothetical protein